MRSNNYKSVLKHAGLAATVLLLASGVAFGQQVNLTAAGTTTALPDGSVVPMWGYSCDAVQPTGSTATCAVLNTTAPAGSWSPVVITVPTGTDLQINLTNNLSFGTAPNNIPTSLVIVGQLGGGLGTPGSSTASPDHTRAQPVTWPIAADAAGVPLGTTVGSTLGTPPTQGPRVQSFSTEVAVGTPATLCWGVCATGGPALTPGTYLIESGTHPSIQGPMGLYGILVVTTAPSGTTAGTAYGTGATAVTYNADLPLLLSEIDPVQNLAVGKAVGTAGFNETNVWSGLYGGCGNPWNANGTANTTTYGTCYPPAVNYTPLYYLFNGRAFDKTNSSASLFAAAPGSTSAPVTGTVLVRLVNAGLRMHVPSIVGAQTGVAVAPATTPPSGFSLIAEDGNVLPGVPRVQSEVFMAAGKTNDVMINVPSATTALPIFDRELSLSANSIARDAGMLAYISVNGAALPTSGAFSAAATTAVANPDSYYLVGGKTLVVPDVGKGVVANDVNVNGVQALVAPSAGTLALNPDGTFSYVPNSGTTSDSFTYCANGAVTAGVCASGISTTVTLAACTGSCLEAGSGITMHDTTFTANGTFLRIQPPGILAVDKDGAGYPLTVAMSAGNAPVASGGLTLSVDPNGGFSASASCTPTAPATSCPYTFTYYAQNSQGTVSSGSATVTVNFAPATGLSVVVLDGKDVLAAKTNPTITPNVITDYRWIIEEDRTFYVDPNCTTNPPAAGCPGATTAGLGTTGIVPTFGTNFHTSYMPLIAAGCTGQLSCEAGQMIFDSDPTSPTFGQHISAVCDLGNGVCRPDASASGFAQHSPGEVYLDPTKRYYLTIFPGDAGNPFANGNLSADCTNGTASATEPGACGHGMGGAPVRCTITPPATTCSFPTTASPLTVLTQPDPYPPSKLSVFVFEDDFPLNGEHDGGGGIDVIASQESGLGGFNITLFDDAGGTGDATGQMTYDMFNQPLVNSLAGTIDPATGLDACPVTKIPRIGPQFDADGNPIAGTLDPTQAGITGTIVTCPKFESDGSTLSPLAGQAVIANLMPGRYGVVATPGADRIARSEEWLQTNTLDGQKAHDSFLRIGEPSFFQEFGPAGYHVSIGFANPTIINARLPFVCGGADPTVTGNCSPGNTVTGLVTTERMSRTPDERLYASGTNDSFAFTQCYVSLGDPDGEDFAFTKCDGSGHFTLTGIPDGDWRITVFDQWNDMLVDGLSTPVRLGAAGTGNLCPGTGSTQRSCNMGQIAMNQWQANIYTSTFFDANGNGVRDSNETGLSLVPTNIRFRDGSFSNFNNTDLAGNAGFNEIFPLFSWYVIETESTRFKNTGIHVVYDAGGPADGTCTSTTAPCKSSGIAANMANTFETVSVPAALRVPGAVYCADADCSTHPTGIQGGPGSSDAPSACTISPTTGATSCTGTALSTGRIDPPWVTSEGWQGFSGQNSYLEFGKAPFQAGENGGIYGEVIYASTRPFDDPQLLLHTSWTPDVPGVTINLYQVGTAPDGTQSLTLVDTTKTSSWDNWAQGFYPGTNKPYMNCPGQQAQPTTTAGGDLFFFTLYNQPMYLDVYNNGGTPAHTVPNNSQFKCYDGMHNWNQLQPVPYDGMYQFPSIVNRDPTSGAAANVPGTTGNPAGTGTPGLMAGSNCTICVANPTDGTPMLPNGQYVVEMLVPPGYELVKEEDKNILIGDNYIAPVTVQFPGLGGSIYILPDQASVAAVYNGNQGAASGFNPTNAQNPSQTFGRQSSLSSGEGDTGSVEIFWPCVGTTRIVPDFISLFPQSTEVAPFAGAKRNLCDRKLVTLGEQTSALAKFWVFTSAHVAAHFTGVITDDFTSEFDPFSPQFGEKFSPANLPVAIKDWSGQEISRVYADQWGTYDGLTYSSWEVNPPNPTGYAPTMMITCMNDPGTGATPDPLFNPQYSQFCYEIPFMPGQTQYMDTPVVPTSAFAGAGYNNPDCAYPDATPAISEVDGDAIGPWVSAPGKPLTINALGTVPVNNHGYSGPSATTAPFNAKTVVRHYGFGAGTGTVTIGGVNASVSSWNDTQIVVSVPSGVPSCAVQQQAQYGGLPAQCGELVITTVNTAAAGQPSNAKQSIDTVTVTIGGKAPTHVAPTASIQAAIDAANPGDLIIVDPAVHQELLLMWKPIRLQGVGAVASVIDGNPHPAGKLDAWRRQVNCLFGLAINGQPISSTNPYDSTNTFTCTAPMQLQVDRVDKEGILGWDAGVNGNLAEMLQEPTLMGAYEGAGITVLAKGVRYPAGVSPFVAVFENASGEARFPAGTVLLTASTADCGDYVGNFLCNPSRIDGLSVENSSQGGGGIFVHGWAHNLEIANDRVFNNGGTLTGGISIGQGEFSDPLVVGADALNIAAVAAGQRNPGYVDPTTEAVPPRPVPTGSPDGTQVPYRFNTNVNVHHNFVTGNFSYGDELFSASPAGAGGVTFCTGADYYKFNYNWLCGNLSTGDGGGLAHAGFSYNGDIEHNSILFNQSTNPTIPTNGGGLVVMSTSPDSPTTQNGVVVQNECGSVTDIDCGPGLGDGIGPGLVINANLFLGNAAESGSGGAIALEHVNGAEVTRFPNTPAQWHHVTLQNNIIVNNVAGWDGGGVSLLDALNTDIINNTIASNVSTASSGVLFNTLGAPVASSLGPTCTTGCGTASAPQPAGLVSQPNSAILEGAILAIPAVPASAGQPAIPAGRVTCPAGHGNGGTGTGGVINGRCKTYSYPRIANDVFWHNRSYRIGVGTLGVGTLNQQNVVALYDAFGATGTLLPVTAANRVPSQQSTGACTNDTSFWDIGVRGDTGPNNHSGGAALAPTYSVITRVAGYPGIGNMASDPNFLSLYCDGSRTPPESGASGWNVPPGISDATVPNPRFNLTPAATVDEGNNWINISWGPLSLSNPANVTINANGTVQGNGLILGNYALAFNSPAIDWVPASQPYPSTDFFGNPRPDASGFFDVGAIETPGAGTTVAPTVTSVSPPSGRPGTAVTVIIAGTNLSAATAVAVQGAGVSAGVITSRSPTAVTTTFTIAGTATAAAHDVSVTTPGGTATCTACFTVAPATLASITPNHGVRGNTGATGVVVNLVGTNLTGATGLQGLGGGVTLAAGSFVVNSSTSITARLNIAPTATRGVRNLAVGFPTGPASNTVPFSVGPFLTGIAPTSGVRGSSVPVTLTGVGLTGATAINGFGAMVTVSNFTSVSDTQVSATFTIGSAAPPGIRNLNVTTPAGASNAVTFTVTGATVGFAGPVPALNPAPATPTTKNGVVTVTNTASGAAASPLTLTAAPTITRTAGTGAFSITGGTCASGTVLSPSSGPGNTCTINLQYVPPATCTTTATGTCPSTAHVTLTDTGPATTSQNSPNFNGN